MPSSHPRCRTEPNNWCLPGTQPSKIRAHGRVGSGGHCRSSCQDPVSPALSRHPHSEVPQEGDSQACRGPGGGKAHPQLIPQAHPAASLRPILTLLAPVASFLPQTSDPPASSLPLSPQHIESWETIIIHLLHSMKSYGSSPGPRPRLGLKAWHGPLPTGPSTGISTSPCVLQHLHNKLGQGFACALPSPEVPFPPQPCISKS
ncbi:uncharacterized protein LOC111140437 isoform X1 [Enhydra lutris kenyoni]|uniref:Uncharacterized protein LOC111140437 isoform X1 n=1 Tax=Enhydra lutris kenyoni TaxID=391180 RepID=A0A2Y9IIE0_ENHLU|nr:uncharacterized protein LOC111140437 isoform X1 [Enhydra lutris kenyoni]